MWPVWAFVYTPMISCPCTFDISFNIQQFTQWRSWLCHAIVYPHQSYSGYFLAVCCMHKLETFALSSLLSLMADITTCLQSNLNSKHWVIEICLYPFVLADEVVLIVTHSCTINVHTRQLKYCLYIPVGPDGVGYLCLSTLVLKCSWLCLVCAVHI